MGLTGGSVATGAGSVATGAGSTAGVGCDGDGDGTGRDAIGVAVVVVRIAVGVARGALPHATTNKNARPASRAADPRLVRAAGFN